MKLHAAVFWLSPALVSLGTSSQVTGYKRARSHSLRSDEFLLHNLSGRLPADPPQNSSAQIQAADATSEEPRGKLEKPKEESDDGGRCLPLVCFFFIIFAAGPFVTPCLFGDGAPFVNAGITFVAVVLSIYPLQRSKVGPWCRFMLIMNLGMFALAFVQMCILIRAICKGHLMVKNAVVRKIRDTPNAKEAKIPGPRKEYYESDLFKQKCDEVFNKAKKGDGHYAVMGELREAIISLVGSEQEAERDSMFCEAFEKYGTSKVHRTEFPLMMKYFSIAGLREDGRSKTVSHFFEILQLPETATESEAKKKYHQLAKNWHTDKNPNCTSDDFAEVSAAHQAVMAYLQGR